jgi:hypothetical protein
VSLNDKKNNSAIGQLIDKGVISKVEKTTVMRGIGKNK